MCIFVYVCVFMCRGQQSKLGFFLDCSLPCFLRQDLSQNLELACSARLTGQSAPQVLLFMPPQYCDHRCFAVPSCSSSSSSSSSKKSKPGLHTCTENLLWVQPSPQPTASPLSIIVLAVRLERVSREIIHIPAVAFRKMLSFHCRSLHTGLTWSFSFKVKSTLASALSYLSSWSTRASYSLSFLKHLGVKFSPILQQLLWDSLSQ